MDLVPRLLDYVVNFPRTEDASELKSQLSGCTHSDLRAVCNLLRLPISKKNNKKSGYIATLVSYWRGDVPKPSANTMIPTDKSQPKAHLPHHPMPVHEASDVINYVQHFAPNGDVHELRDQLNGCKAVILRSACVQLDLRPHRKNFAKPNFVDLLVEYWQQFRAGSSPRMVASYTSPVTLDPEVTPRNVNHEIEIVKEVRSRGEELLLRKKRAKVERSDGEEKSTLTTSLEKAKVVKEWASAIEILSRVDGSADSIASIRALIDDVVESAALNL
ncbi:uncharacterized protein PHALS_08478 [Plasmopara halstedii]|uniref:Uncharacterized protein n=1 Tax=Plasmopara halstedii TaxID=4781 RepID=A0A0P1ACJ2_PLAHL|nr:uncharacterized protein PHALS_08478 [Plasmopara halstedii]CEG38400.1 hypothetical protein PHALS_08478 [Plasmopara halstedii]|eukprot:XP_024574769.1 hypothetical protein PHALS_08478 [Plasmopara halstedii]